MVTTNKKLKVVWIIYGPRDIQINIAQELGKFCNLTLIFRKTHKHEDFPRENYSQIFLQCYEKGILRIIFLPQIIANLFKKNKSEFSPLIYFEKLFSTLKKEKPEIVISNLCYMPATWQAANYCKKTNTSFIFQTEMQNLPTNKLAKLYTLLSFKILKNLLFMQAKAILPWTTNALRFAQRHFPIKDKSKIKLLPAGIKIELFDKPTTTHRKSSVIKLIVVSRLIPYKRIIDLLKALKHLKDNTKIRFHLDILGEGYLKNRLKRDVKTMNLKEIVKFLPARPLSTMVDLYHQHDIFILPSYNEAIGMVAPEAMLCGLPVIVSDTCGAATYVKDGENGYIFKTFDYIDLANKILMLKDQKVREKMGMNAKKHIKDNFDVKIISQKFFRILEDVYERRKIKK